MEHTLLHKITYAALACICVVASVYYFNLGLTEIKGNRLLSSLQSTSMQIHLEDNNLFTVTPYSEISYSINSNINESSLHEIKGDGFSLFSIWMGLSCLILCLIFIFITFSFHRIIVFLFLLSITQMLVLIYVGFSVTAHNLERTVKHVQSQNELLNEIDNIELKNYYISSYYQQLYSNAYHQLDHFPDNIIASITTSGLPKVDFEILKSSVSPITIKNAILFNSLPLSIILFVICLWVGIKYTIKKRMLENIPTSKIKDLMVGLSEVNGTAIQYEDRKLIAPLNGCECFWYTYDEAKMDVNNKWHSIHSYSTSKLFKCKDDSGAELLVNPLRSEISTKFKEETIIDNIRYTVNYLPFGEPIFLFGNTSVTSASGRLMMKAEIDQPLIISSYSEESIKLKKGIVAMIMLGVVFSVSILSSLLGLVMIGSFEPSNYILLALLVPLFFILMVSILHYYDLIFLQNRVDCNFLNIQTSLKKRYDSFAKLQKLLKRHIPQEKKLLSVTGTIRNNIKRVINIEHCSANRIDKVLQQCNKFNNYFNTIIEKYPDLKTDELIQYFIKQQNETEYEISLMRAAYNDSVNKYNKKIQSFSYVLLAKKFKFNLKNHL
ncbi:MAG: LemA family protein [Saccharospirillaceae bacterium]|nr:LemA family protein [Pseudomonadales bacterium]NRB77818.1 LemA family protein [Saccharospirillaceae bacterium]